MSNRSIVIGSAIAFLALALVAIVDTIPDLERELEQRTAVSLDELGIEYEEINFSGRIGTVRVPAGSADGVRATLDTEVEESFFNDVFRLNVETGDTSTAVEPPPTTIAAATTTTTPATTVVPTTAPPTTVAAAAIEAEIEAVTALQGISFSSGGSSLTPGSQSALDEIAVVLIANPEMSITVEGHTDSQGADAANQALSEARATSVVDYLITKDVGADRLTATGFGESQPIADNATAAGRAENRRIEFSLTNGSN